MGLRPALPRGDLYIGATRDLPSRAVGHRLGKACRTTAREPPSQHVHLELFDSYSDALRRELQLNRWSRAKKEALIATDADALRRLSKRHG